MTPMFVETQSSQGSESAAASQSGSMRGKLRATQTSLEFSQTQTPGTAAARRGTGGRNLNGEVKACDLRQGDGRRITG